MLSNADPSAPSCGLRKTGYVDCYLIKDFPVGRQQATECKLPREIYTKMNKERIHNVIIWLLTKIFQSTVIIHILASTLTWEQNAVSILSSIQNGSSFIDAFQSYFIPSNILNKIICYTLERELTTILKYFTLIFSFVQVVSNLKLSFT